MDFTGVLEPDFAADVPFGDDAAMNLRWVSNEEILECLAKAEGPDGKLNHAAYNVELGKKAITGWRGFTHAGKPFPYTAENRDLLMRREQAVISFVQKWCRDRSAMVALKRSQDEGNSEGTPAV